MNQILPYLLRVGHMGDGQDVKALFDQGIRAVVQLAWEEAPLLLPREFIVCRFPLADAIGNQPEVLRMAVEVVTLLLRERVSTLLCCHMGLSRAPALAAAGLARFSGRPLHTCLEEVARYHHCDVHPGLYEQLEGILAASAS
jgi:hypothetical protein